MLYNSYTMKQLDSFLKLIWTETFFQSFKYLLGGFFIESRLDFVTLHSGQYYELGMGILQVVEFIKFTMSKRLCTSLRTSLG